MRTILMPSPFSLYEHGNFVCSIFRIVLGDLRHPVATWILGGRVLNGGVGNARVEPGMLNVVSRTTSFA
jgi:hypothetical protein